VILMMSDNELFIYITCILLNKEYSIYPLRLPAKPWTFNSINNLLCKTESKAFQKSRYNSHKKNIKNSCLSPTFGFISVAVETLGSSDDEASAVKHQLGRCITSVTGERRATECLLQRLSAAIQRGQCQLCAGQN